MPLTFPDDGPQCPPGRHDGPSSEILLMRPWCLCLPDVIPSEPQQAKRQGRQSQRRTYLKVK